MGLILSLIFGSGRTDDPDPITGFTTSDKYLVQKSWEYVKTDLTKNGMDVLTAYLDKYPEAQEYFPFRDVPREELRNNKRFQAHCNGVMYLMTSIVDSVDDPELLVQILRKQGINHKRWNISPSLFWDIKNVMLDLFRTRMMHKSIMDSWEKVLDVSFQLMVNEL